MVTQYCMSLHKSCRVSLAREKVDLIDFVAISVDP